MCYIGEGASARDAVTAALFDAETSFARLQRRAPAERYEIPYASLMLAVRSGDALDFVWYGDCAAIVGHGDGRVEVVGEALAKRTREAERVKRLSEAKGEASAAANVRDVFLPALRAARNLVNTPKGGYLFGPDVVAADHAGKSRIRVAARAHIMLVTDGFLALAGDYRRYDVEGLLKASVERGLVPLGCELRAIEDGDPEGRQYPRFKKSDDATAVLVKLTSG